ncbi:MAG TPA: SEC-C metal-binding domain-containing protein [Acidimicrobiia bacterium]|nr:SEC-C metal-binding domain-containing protein [Acidimicrobiia bacterium]
MEAFEWRLELEKKLARQPSGTGAKTGRNERCPCGSGLKYKQCHGLCGGSRLRPT